MSDINSESVLKAFVDNEFMAWPHFSIKRIFPNIDQGTDRASLIGKLIRELEEDEFIEEMFTQPYGLGWKITDKGRSEYERLHQETMNKIYRQQLEDQKFHADHATSIFQATTGKKITVAAFVLSIFAIIVSVIAIIVSHNDTKPNPLPYDTAAANTRLYNLEKRIQAIEKAKADTTLTTHRSVSNLKENK